MKDEKLIQRIQSGDESAMDHVINKYSRLLWTVAEAVLGSAASSQDIEECVADVFIALWQEPEKFDPSRGTMKAYLTVMARSKATDRCRQILRRGDVPLEETIPARQLGLADGLAAREQQEALAKAVSALGEPDREILLRRYCREQKPRQIALALDMPVKHVENHLYRAKRRLRAMLSEE